MPHARPFTAGIANQEGLGPLPESALGPDGQPPRVLVIGAGISGLTSAIILQEMGCDVEIWAKECSPHTTSDVAGAAWYPYKATGDNFNGLSLDTRTALEDQKQRFGSKRTGIIESEIIDLHRNKMPDPDWAAAARNFRHPNPDELPPGYIDGFAFEAPVIDMGRYLSFLSNSFVRAGGRIAVREVTDLADTLAEHPIVVNCTGVESRRLTGDTDIHPARGQVVKVKPPAGLKRRVLIDESRGRLTYIIPRIDDVVLGGSFEEYDNDLTVNDAQTRDILQRTAKLDPALRGISEADIVKVAVGLRPIRSSILLEGMRPTPDQIALINVGHGGSGVTLSWGCAGEIGRILRRMLT